MNNEIIKIKCKDCGVEFDFTPGEQKFYAEKGLANPIRCKACRDARKARYAAKEVTTKDKDEDFNAYLLGEFTKNTVKIED
jgi:hypothetical protein